MEELREINLLAVMEGTDFEKSLKKIVSTFHMRPNVLIFRTKADSHLDVF